MAAEAAAEGATAVVRRKSWHRPKSNQEASLKGPTSGPLKTVGLNWMVFNSRKRTWKIRGKSQAI